MSELTTNQFYLLEPEVAGEPGEQTRMGQGFEEFGQVAIPRGAIGYVLSEAIVVHQVIGIYELECRFSQKYGPDALLANLAKQGMSRTWMNFARPLLAIHFRGSVSEKGKCLPLPSLHCCAVARTPPPSSPRSNFRW